MKGNINGKVNNKINLIKKLEIQVDDESRYKNWLS